MALTTGTLDTKTEHREGPAYLNVATAVGIPFLIGVIGLAVRGWDAISWVGAILWGFVATVFAAFVYLVARTLEVTRMNIFDLLGSFAAPAGSDRARRLGVLILHGVGILQGVAWAFGCALVGVPTNWFTGLVWGLILTVLAAMFLSSIGAVHPRIRRGEAPDPGPLAVHMGAMTPTALLISHALYGLVLGWGYAAWA